MSYAMTHLIIANEFAQKNHVAQKELFLLANISPDVVHDRPDFTFQLKADAHYLQPELKWGQIYTEEEMIKWYNRLREFYHEKCKLVTNDNEMTFLQGYTLHILVDIFNCKLLYAKNLIRYEFKVELMREKYRKECILQDNFLYKNHAGGKQIMDDLLNASNFILSPEILKHLQLDDLISVQNIKDNVRHMVENYQNAEDTTLDNLEMVSEEASCMFLETVENEVNRLLYDFPEARRTFEIC